LTCRTIAGKAAWSGSFMARLLSRSVGRWLKPRTGGFTGEHADDSSSYHRLASPRT
jgi:hypothetical protein